MTFDDSSSTRTSTSWRSEALLTALLVTGSTLVYCYRPQIADEWRFILALAAAGFVFAPISNRPLSLLIWFPAVALYALGVGLAHANSASLALRFVPGPSLGQAGATNRIMTEIGSVCSVAVTIALLVGADDPVEGVRRVMLLLALAGIGGMVVAAGVDTRPRQMRSAEAE